MLTVGLVSLYMLGVFGFLFICRGVRVAWHGRNVILEYIMCQLVYLLGSKYLDVVNKSANKRANRPNAETKHSCLLLHLTPKTAFLRTDTMNGHF